MAANRRTGDVRGDAMFMTRYGSVASQIVGGGGGYDEYTKTMLHFNGTDGSTTFTDEIGRIWTANGNAQLDTAQKKFGTASGLFDGSSWIDTPATDDFNVGGDNFTIDFWFSRISAGYGETQFVCGQADPSGSTAGSAFNILFLSTNILRANFHYGSNNISVASAAIVNTAWHHTAIVRNGNSLTLYVDGVGVSTISVAGITVNSSTYKLAIGRRGEVSGNCFNGYIDEFRVKNGDAVWTANFTPPTGEYAA